MNRAASESEKYGEWAELIMARLHRRCEPLGLRCLHLTAHDDCPAETHGLDPEMLSGLQAGAVGIAVDGPQDTAGIRFDLSIGNESLGSLIIVTTHTIDVGTTPSLYLQSLAPALSGAIDDAVEIVEMTHDIEDFADQMSNAFETIDLMYTLGRSMTGLDNPDRFIMQACDRLRQTLGFGYVAVHLPADAEVGDDLAGQTYWEAQTEQPAEDAQLDRIMTLMAQAGERLDAFNGPQAVVRPLVNDAGIVGMIVGGDKTVEAGNVSSYDTKLIDAVGGLLSTFLTNTRLYSEQREMAMGVLESLSNAIDAKDPYTRGHAQRVAYLSEQIALGLGFEPAAAERLRIAGLLHDVGKIGVSEAVLQKAGKLTDDEFLQIKKHPEIGYRILKGLKGLEDVLPAVLHHHERLDGRGYPAGLREDEIPLSARIVAAADTFDAMSSTRSYRARMPLETVLEEIRRSAGTQLDPAVVESLLSLDLTQFDRFVEDFNGISDSRPKAA